MAKTVMEIYEIEKIQSFRRLGVTVECITAYDDNLMICIRNGQLLENKIYEPQHEKTRLRGFQPDNTLLICIRGGQLLEYKIFRNMSAGPRYKSVRFESKTYRSFSNKPVTEIHAFPECGLLVSLSDSVLHLYDLNTLEFKMTISKSKGTSLVAFDLKEKYDKKSAVLQYEATLKICAAIGRKLHIWKWKNDKLIEIQSNLNLCKAPRALVWCKNIMFVGFKDEYFMINVPTAGVEDLCNVGSSQKEPLLSKLDGQTVLVGYDFKSIVMEISLGQPPRKDFYLMWSNVPQFIVYDPPYVVAVLEKHIEVRSFKPSAFLQTLDIKNIRFICKGSDFLFVESNNTVSVLVPKLIRERISCHMDQDQFEVALQLAQRSCSLEGSEEEKCHLEEKINCRHAIHLFSQHKYKEALDIFLKLDIDPSHVVGLYPHLLPSKQRNSLTLPTEMPRLEGVDYEKAVVELIEYLTEKRKAIESETTLKPLSPIMEGNETAKTQEQVLSVIDTTLLKCYLTINEALIAPLLRNSGHHVNVRDVQKVLLKKQKFSELTILYQQHNMHVEALEMLKTQANKTGSPLYGPDMTVHYLQGLGEENLPIIFKYSEWVLKDYPAEGLKIFTDDDPMVQSLPRGHILSFILKISKQSAIYYLEHVIYQWKDTTEELHLTLVQLLRDKVEKLQHRYMKTQSDGNVFPTVRSLSGQLAKYRNKLIYFLDNTNIYDPAHVLMRFSTLPGCYEERAILFGRIHKHEQALGIYIMILKDPVGAEKHCRKHYNTDNPLDRDVYLSLLKIYLDPPDPKALGLSEYQYKPEPNNTAAITLLEENYAFIDPIKALEILPPEMTVRDLQIYLEASMLSSTKLKYECLVRKKIQFADYRKISEERIHYDNTQFVVTQGQTCTVCHRKLDHSLAFARYPDGAVVHYACCKHAKTVIDRIPSLPTLIQQIEEMTTEFGSNEEIS